MAEEQRETQDVREGDGTHVQRQTSRAIDGVPSTRREFLTGALAVSGVALAGLPQPVAAQPVAIAQPIGEIPRSSDGKLRAIITIRNAEQEVHDPVAAVVNVREQMRYFEGKDASGKLVWPLQPPSGTPRTPLPGPTLRARVGDQVEITFLNHVAVDQFGGTLDRAETGDSIEGCDGGIEPTTGTNLYPKRAGDESPNCFHGSSTANMHFHGTHVTPDGLGDNVLLQLRPYPQMTEEAVRDDFARIFEAGPPARWQDLPKSWRDRQLRLLKAHDETATWRGRRGTPGHPELPRENQLLPPTLELVESGLWPQYQIGAYPFCYTLTRYLEDSDGNPIHYAMGQCPGTHWYHAHKHGSTALNVLNGMAGAFIIEGDYDDALDTFDKRIKQTEKVLIVQNFSDAPQLVRQMPEKANQPHSLWVNGRRNPTIKMQPGEIQLWRFVNASVRAVTTVKGFDPTNGITPEIKQTAQDGVQFRFENYDTQPIRRLPSTGAPRPYSFAPGNRMDLLVKAPLQTGPYAFKVIDTTLEIPEEFEILTLSVEGDRIDPPMQFPETEKQYPQFPRFLSDITADQVRIWRKLDFGWEANRTKPGLGTEGKGPAPKFMIDGKQFKNGRYDQTMILGDTEEWKLTNSTARIAHPFHIHINPFQIVEIYDPNMSDQPYKPDKNFVWQDVIAIPPAKTDSGGKLLLLDPATGKARDPGYVKIRHRFVDFPGSYVLHCHMLAHEDRGMMQLVRVIPGETIVKHH